MLIVTRRAGESIVIGHLTMIDDDLLDELAAWQEVRDEALRLIDDIVEDSESS